MHIRKIVLFLLVVFGLSMVPCLLQGAVSSRSTPPTKTGWTLVFNDEFDDSAGNLSHGYMAYIDGKWQPTGGDWWSGEYIHGDEQQYYTRYDIDYSTWGTNNYLMSSHDSNFQYDTANDRFSLVLREEPHWQWIPGWMTQQTGWITGTYQSSSPSIDHTDDWYGYYTYTSAWIETIEKFKYGYFEIRCKLPNEGRVIWPAFWLFGADWDQPAAYGETAHEIDGFEFASYTANRFTRNLHNYFDKDFFMDKYGTAYHDDKSISDTQVVLHDYYNEVPSGLDVEEFHTYAFEWRPHKIVFYIDGTQVGPALTDHIPTNPMRLIVNIAMPGWDNYKINDPNTTGSDITFPASFDIEYVRVYKRDKKEFIWQWSNNGNNFIDGWNLASTDTFITGNFYKSTGTDKDEVMAFSQSGYSRLLEFDGTDWSHRGGNSGSGTIGSWTMAVTDRHIPGDYDGDGQDEVLMIAANGNAGVLEYNGTSWLTPWTNSGGGSINWWSINSGDQYIAGDFDNDGKDELLAVNDSTNHAHLMNFTGTSWSTAWTNSGNGTISTWTMNSGDKYLAGDFDNDGKAELLAINSGSGNIRLMKYSYPSWTSQWYTSTGIIHWWYVNADDIYRVDDIDNDGKDEILALNNTSGYAHLMDFTGTAWSTSWSNEGSGFYHDATSFMVGDFYDTAECEWLSIAFNAHGKTYDWAYMMKFMLP